MGLYVDDVDVPAVLSEVLQYTVYTDKHLSHTQNDIINTYYIATWSHILLYNLLAAWLCNILNSKLVKWIFVGDYRV